MADSDIGIIAGDYGVVEYRDWHRVPWTGNNCKGLAGRMTVLQDTAAGINVNARDSNWLIKVQGRNETVVIPGCQVASVFTWPEDAPMDNADFLTVP